MTTSQTTQMRTALAAMLVPLALAACARSGAQEFDVSGQVAPAVARATRRWRRRRVW
jgi:post-segregation antitoxin (ccd killing protein)